ncbi:hypothetical protein [Micromonospora auratinigra]|uniref:Integrin beta 8 n=1 Tax=Micromonospora auratinigra TaxID=261654 RepID=A0A1A9A1T4_9ACTN|nr:hypothetical protein [Micromonospora auratinigra]SBT50103.1 hypothetical protein GA0070611_4659 [Micromonospora auratinigra]
MTSEAPHRPGQEPGEVSPGAGGPVPYGDRPAPQDNGYPGAPDLGWAPPPPAGRPAPSAPAWAAQEEQPAPWAAQGGQPANRGSAQVPAPAEPGGWNGAPQPAWGAEQHPPAWGAAAATPPGEPSPPSWGPPADADAPAWGAAAPQAATHGEQPAWGQPAEPAARGAAQVPAPATVPNESWGGAPQQDDPNRSGGWAGQAAPQHDDPNRSGGWGTPQQDADAGRADWHAGQQEDRSGGWSVGAGTQPHDDPNRSGGWNGQAAAPQDDPNRSGGWNGQAAPQQDDPNRSGGWGTPQQDEQPAWGQPGEPAPAWAAPAAPPARAAAKVPVPGQGDNAWAGRQDDPNRSGGWQADEAAAPGGPQDDPNRSGGWAAPRDEDPDRSGGWAAGRAAAPADAPQQPAWGAPGEQRPAAAWSGAAAVPQQRDQDEAAQPDWAAAPTGDDRPETGGWAQAEPPARASASVPAADTAPAWADNQDNQDNPAQWTSGQRPAVPEAAPWAPGEAWGRAAEGEPAYQPAPGPGISPANAVPLPPQEQRVPGAALAAAPPADYAPPAEREPQAYEPERAAGGWGTAEPSHEEPQSPAGPVVPGPRTSPESTPDRAVSASASVPTASRVMPPTDQPLPGSGGSAPQPRVYGRPTRPESEETPGQDGPDGFGPHDEHGSQSRMDAPNGFAEAPPVSSAPPSSPAAPPPFPPGVPSFADPAGNDRPVNGVHPQSGERTGDPFGMPADAFGGPGGQREPFGGPGGQSGHYGGPGAQPGQFGGPGGQHDQFGGPGGHQDQFGGPGGQHDQFGGPEQHDRFDGQRDQHDPFGGHRDQFGGPNQHDPFGGRQDQFGGPGQHEPFGGPGSGRASVAVPGQEPGGFPPAFPPPPQQAPPAWQQGPAGDQEQGRFDQFKPEAEPKTEAPAPKVRNGKVLILVLIVAALILTVPLGLLALLGKLGGDDDTKKPAPFNPAVGACVKQADSGPAEVACEPGAFTVVSKVDNKDKCPDPTQPTVTRGTQVYCLKPVTK